MNGNEKEIVSLNGENGKKIDFELIAELEYDGYNYQILRPLKKYKDLDSDQAIVFRLENLDGGTEYFIEEDDDVISEIGNIYNSEL